MKPTIKAVMIACLLTLFVAAANTGVIMPVSAYNQNLAVTHGASGTWITGGYGFNHTAFATRDGFIPFHGWGAFTVVTWLKLNDLNGADAEMIFASQVDTTHQVRLYFNPANDKISAQAADGSTVITIATAALGSTDLIMVTYAWDKDDNSGKIDLYVNTTKVTSVAGITNVISANTEMDLGRLNDNTFFLNASLFCFYVFDYKLSSAQVAEYLAGDPDYIGGSPPVDYWLMNEGSGNTFFGNQADWYQAQEVTLYLVPPAWVVAQVITQAIGALVFSGSIFFIVSLSGLILLPCSTVYLAWGGKDSLSWKKFETFILIFFLGWALFLGGLAI